MCRLEFTATPATSPKFVPAGSLSRSAFASKRISGTATCATAMHGASVSNKSAAVRFIGSSRGGRQTYLRTSEPARSATHLVRHDLHVGIDLAASQEKHQRQGDHEQRGDQREHVIV